MNAPAIRYVGQPLRRREDFKFLTGKGRYVAKGFAESGLLVGRVFRRLVRRLVRHVGVRSLSWSRAHLILCCGRDLRIPHPAALAMSIRE